MILVKRFNSKAKEQVRKLWKIENEGKKFLLLGFLLALIYLGLYFNSTTQPQNLRILGCIILSFPVVSIVYICYALDFFRLKAR
jgi:uncharacterized membrane protein HdeD (DUF308 family)